MTGGYYLHVRRIFHLGMLICNVFQAVYRKNFLCSATDFELIFT
jgi:hypothetical protein